MTILLIENRDDVVKHKESAAILAADMNAYQAYLQKRKLQLTSEQKIDSLEKRVEQLELMIKTLINTK